MRHTERLCLKNALYMERIAYTICFVCYPNKSIDADLNDAMLSLNEKEEQQHHPTGKYDLPTGIRKTMVLGHKSVLKWISRTSHLTSLVQNNCSLHRIETYRCFCLYYC